MDELYARYLTLESFAARIVQNNKRLKRIRYTDNSSHYTEDKPIQKKQKTFSEPSPSYSHFVPVAQNITHSPKILYCIKHFIL